VIKVELLRLARRPRTWAVLMLLCALPIVVAVFVAVTNLVPQPGQGPAFLSAVLSDGSLYPAAGLAIVLPVFLPVSVAVFSGDAVAGESSTGMLRYLLARPVSRTRLLIAKLAGTMSFVLLAVVLVAITSYITGVLAFGTGGLRPVTAPSGGGSVASPVTGTSIGTVSTSLSGTPLTTAQLIERVAMGIVYISVSMLGVAAIALFLSTITDSALGAAMGALAALVTSEVLATLDAAGSVKPYLPTNYWLAWIDLFRQPILWHDVQRGLALQAVYALVFLGAAWANFSTKDVAG
jgi:ABC-2 type transport system permease protein